MDIKDVTLAAREHNPAVIVSGQELTLDEFALQLKDWALTGLAALARENGRLPDAAKEEDHLASIAYFVGFLGAVRIFKENQHMLRPQRKRWFK